MSMTGDLTPPGQVWVRYPPGGYRGPGTPPGGSRYPPPWGGTEVQEPPQGGLGAPLGGVRVPPPGGYRGPGTPPPGGSGSGTRPGGVRVPPPGGYPARGGPWPPCRGGVPTSVVSKLQLSSSAVSWPYIALCPMELWVMLQSIMGVKKKKKKKKKLWDGYPPPCGQTD